MSGIFFTSERIANGLIRSNRLLLGSFILLTLALALPAFSVRLDTSGVTFNADDSEEYSDYKAFTKSFGTDNYILLAVETNLPVSHPDFKNRIIRVHQGLMAFDSVSDVVDLTSLEGSLILKLIPTPSFWSESALAEFRGILPGINRLISKDLKTLGFLIRIDNEKLNGFELTRQLREMKQIIAAAFPEYPHCHAAGIPVLKSAFERYNLVSAIVFGSLGLLFGILVAFYIFKTWWAGFLVMIASVGSVIWILGIMGMFNIELNLATGLSFGFVLVVSTTTVFHIISKYFELQPDTPGKPSLTQTFALILRPCFMCALTTSAGFATLAMSPVKMVHQAGIVISIGVMIAFLLTVLISSFFLPVFFKARQKRKNTAGTDSLDIFSKKSLLIGIQKPGISVMTGMIFFILMAAGIPGIETGKHLTSPMIKSTSEAADLHFIETHLLTGTSFSIILQCNDNWQESRKFWYDLYRFEKGIRSIAGIQEIESLTPLVFRTALQVSPAGAMPEFVFRQFLLKDHDSDFIRSYLDPVSKKLRIIVHIQNLGSAQTETILQRIKEEADRFLAPEIRYTFSGQLILLRSQTSDLVASQLKALFLALLVITTLMVLQLRSFVLGLMSLIPNLFPLVTIFGIMGWFHIPLDPLTIFAAVISFGLSVDDSIHYLTQLSKELNRPIPGYTIKNCLETVHRITSRALVSTTLVLFLSSLGLLFSSFTHVFSLGVLISAASVSALIGDLIFMPALLLSVAPFGNLLSRKMKNRVALDEKK